MRFRTLAWLLVVAATAVPQVGCFPGPPPSWQLPFRYTAEELHGIEIGEFGFPYVPVTIGGKDFVLPFDTGNTIGLSLSSEQFDKLRLATADTYDRRNSAGEVVGTLRVGEPQEVTVLDRDLGRRPIYEFDHPTLQGLVGPDFMVHGHFTLDYGSKWIAVSQSPLPGTIPGFLAMPLVRSHRHPALILVRGAIGRERVLLELDTGKSRSVINPQFAARLGLEPSQEGVRIDGIRIGNLRYSVPSAKLVDQTGIDPDLPEPIMAGLGSDILSKFVWTVDYVSGLLWIKVSP